MVSTVLVFLPVSVTKSWTVIWVLSRSPASATSPRVRMKFRASISPCCAFVSFLALGVFAFGSGAAIALYSCRRVVDQMTVTLHGVTNVGANVRRHRSPADFFGLKFSRRCFSRSA
jgi:hypothetical protein